MNNNKSKLKMSKKNKVIMLANKLKKFNQQLNNKIKKNKDKL